MDPGLASVKRTNTEGFSAMVSVPNTQGRLVVVTRALVAISLAN